MTMRFFKVPFSTGHSIIKSIKKIRKILFYFLLAVILLPVFLILILQFSFVQTFVAQKCAAYLSAELQAEVKVGSINITFLFDVVLEDVIINDLHNNPMLDVKTLIIDMNNIYFNRGVISVDKLVLEKAKINLVKYKNEKTLNYQFIADYFRSDDTTTTKDSKNWKIWAGSLVLIDNHFKYQDQNKPAQEKGIDFNNLDISSVNTIINNLAIIKDTIYADIRSLSLNDKSGFNLKRFSALAKISSGGINAKNLHIETPGTSLSMNLAFDFTSYDDFSEFIDKVKIEALFKPSRLDFNDIGYFAPELLGMDNIINLSGEIKGKISNLKGNDFQFLYGKSTYFLGNFNISGLPDIEGTYINFKIKNFFICQQDIRSFKFPSSEGIQQLSLPEEIVRFGNVRFTGVFTGFYNDFVAYGDFYTDMGKISTDLTLRKNTRTNQIEYSGKVATANLYLGRILSMQEDLGFISMNADVTGSGLDAENAEIKIKGNIASIDIMNYHYKNIKMEGNLVRKKFNGLLKINDDNVKFDIDGMVDYSKNIPVFNVESKIENLRFSKLHILDLADDSLSSLSTELKLNFEGNTIDNLQGTIRAKNTSYAYKGEKYFLKNFIVSNTAEETGNKTLIITSDYVDADISGNFMFKNLYFSSLKFIKDYMPSFSTWIKDSIPQQSRMCGIEYFIKLKNTSPLCKLFIPKLAVSANTVLKGNYNSKQSLLDLNVTSALIQYNGYKFKDFFLSCKTQDSKININLGCERIAVSDSLGLDNFTLKSVTRNDSINYNLTWENNNDQIKNSGNIVGFLTFFQRPKIELKFIDATLVVNDTAWKIDQGNDIFFDSNAVTINNLVVSSEKQQLKISGGISENPADILHVNFKDFNVSDLDMLTSTSGFDFDGYLNGDVDVSNVYKSLNIVSNLVISDLYVNKEKLGKAILINTWDDQKKTVTINADILYDGASGTNKPISVSGNYYPESEKENFDLDIDLTNFKLKLLEKYLSGFSSNLKGFATGKLKLKGTVDEPDINGHLFLMVKGFKIDYLNENYTFTDSIFVNKNSFSFDHVVLNDAYGDTAICDGKIFHKNFKDFEFDLTFKPYKFQCLNTNPSLNNLFYGTAYVSGLVKITGNEKNINIDVSAKTEKNTHLFIPISSESEMSDNNYIRFVNSKSKASLDENYNVDLSGIQMNFVLDVTNDAEVQIIFDSKIGDIIKARGNGNIKMEITTLGDFNMYGDYVIEQGDYLFTLKNVINKKFIIEKGSSIKWNGNPYDGIADITAVYHVKTSLFNLNPLDSSAENKKRIDVDCLLSMKDKIFNPTITFGIDLPNSDDVKKNLVKSHTSTEEEMNRQIFSLLILNSFTTESNILNSVGTGLGSTSTEMLSNQLSNWLSQINKNFDIGVNYHPGTQMTSEEMEVALSTQIFNDRLSIDGNVGVSNNQGNASKASNIVGDVNLDYKLTDRFHAKFYNKSNTVDLLNSNSPYTQGIGILYRKEFDAFSELFRKKKKMIQ